MSVPEIDLSDPEIVRDPFAAYGRVRESSPLARTAIPGIGPVWVLTRHEGARAMLGDPRFEIASGSFLRPDVPEDCLPYLRTMSEMNGQGHKRLRALVAPAFSVRRAEEFRPRIAPIVERLLDELPGRVEDGAVDLLAHVMRPLPMDVICELVGIPESDRPRWREYGAAVAAGSGQGFAEAVPGIVAGAKAAIARRRTEPADDVLGDLVRAQADDGDRLTDAEMVTLVWHLVIAGQTPTNFLANAVAALLSHPDQLAALRADPALLPRAVDELIRWCGPALLTVPRFAREDVELFGEPVRKGEAAMASIAAVNRDPRAFADPDHLDVRRTDRSGHLGFGHGPHFCLGSAVARVQAEVALAALLGRFPDLASAVDLDGVRAPDPGTWRLTALPVIL